MTEGRKERIAARLGVRPQPAAAPAAAASFLLSEDNPLSVYPSVLVLFLSVNPDQSEGEVSSSINHGEEEQEGPDREQE